MSRLYRFQFGLMDSFNLAELLKSPDGIQALQSLEGSGLSFDSPKSTGQLHQLDFGTHCIDDLEYEIEAPLGYEGCRTDKDCKIIEKSLLIRSTSHIYTIKSIDILPANGIKYPNMTVLCDGVSISSSSKPIIIQPNSSTPMELHVIIRVKRDYIGFLGRWIIFTFEKKYQLSLTCMRTETFIYGLRVHGCIARSNSTRNTLSSEAKIFVPQASITYFEAPVRILCYTLYK